MNQAIVLWKKNTVHPISNYNKIYQEICFHEKSISDLELLAGRVLGSFLFNNEQQILISTLLYHKNKEKYV